MKNESEIEKLRFYEIETLTHNNVNTVSDAIGLARRIQHAT